MNYIKNFFAPSICIALSLGLFFDIGKSFNNQIYGIIGATGMLNSPSELDLIFSGFIITLNGISSIFDPLENLHYYFDTSTLCLAGLSIGIIAHLPVDMVFSVYARLQFCKYKKNLNNLSSTFKRIVHML